MRPALIGRKTKPNADKVDMRSEHLSLKWNRKREREREERERESETKRFAVNV